MQYKQNTDCRSWQFTDIPEFRSGKMSEIFADCGPGLNDDYTSITDDNTFMHKFTGVSVQDVTDYAAVLSGAGFPKLYENEIAGNLYYQFRTPDGLLYISYLKPSETARFILDRCDTMPIGFYGYSKYTETNGDTEFVQYSLYYSHMTKGTTCDCGMNYIYRLRDNSLIIIDGGEMEQCTDIAIADYMKLLEELTGAKEGEKIRISLWFCTHAHNDHMDFFSKLMLLYHDRLTVERAAFNFPAFQNTKGSVSVSKMRERLAKYYPDIIYLKFHAGCRFSIANADICVFTAAEDIIANEEDDPFSGVNSSCSIFSITAEDIRTVFLADAGENNAEVLTENYPPDLLNAVFLQAAHHGINSIYNAYEVIEAKKLLLPQCMMNMETRFQENYRHYCDRYGEENIILAHDRTDIFTMQNGKYSVRGRDHVGTAYDGSEW